MKKIIISTILVFFSLRAFCSYTVDSLGVKSEYGVSYVLHKVGKDETLYSLCKRYGCTKQEVFAWNKELNQSSTILLEQVLKFPIKRDVLYHVVQEGETLYSISKSLKVEAQSLMLWNNLSGNMIQVGQKLQYRSNNPSISVSTKEVLVSELATSLQEEKTYPAPVSEVVDNFVVPNAPSGKKIEETGLVKIIASTRNTSKHLALHKDAPLGTLLAIKNEATKKQVVVKVIGKLPDTGENTNILVRLSPAAYYKLGPNDGHLFASVSYVLPPTK